MIAEEDFETREEKKLRFKKEFGKNMSLKNKQCGNSTEDMEKTDGH